MSPTAAPYRDALCWIEAEGFGTGSAMRLAKAVLSLYNADEHPWSIRDCLDGLDGPRAKIVLAMVLDYARNGETHELREVGAQVCKLEPGLVEVGKTMQDARHDLHRRWDREREAETAREQAIAEQRERDRADGRGEPPLKPQPLRKPGQLRAGK